MLSRAFTLRMLNTIYTVSFTFALLNWRRSGPPFAINTANEGTMLLSVIALESVFFVKKQH